MQPEHNQETRVVEHSPSETMQPLSWAALVLGDEQRLKEGWCLAFVSLEEVSSRYFYLQLHPT